MNKMPIEDLENRINEMYNSSNPLELYLHGMNDCQKYQGVCSGSRNTTF
jgi:hypothetical protein